SRRRHTRCYRDWSSDVCSSDLEPSLAEAGGGFGRVVRVSSVEASVHVGQLVIQIPDLEIAPHPVILAIARFDVELAHGWRHFLHHTVVAERWVIIVGIDAPE